MFENKSLFISRRNFPAFTRLSDSQFFTLCRRQVLRHHDIGHRTTRMAGKAQQLFALLPGLGFRIASPEPKPSMRHFCITHSGDRASNSRQQQQFPTIFCGQEANQDLSRQQQKPCLGRSHTTRKSHIVSSRHAQAQSPFNFQFLRMDRSVCFRTAHPPTRLKPTGRAICFPLRGANSRPLSGQPYIRPIDETGGMYAIFIMVEA